MHPSPGQIKDPSACHDITLVMLGDIILELTSGSYLIRPFRQ